MNSLKENEKVNFGQQADIRLWLTPSPKLSPIGLDSDTRQLLSEMLWDKI